MSSIHIDPSNHPITASIPKAAQDNFDALCQELQSQLCSLGYQRTSGFRSSADSICCDVLRLNDSAIQLHDNIELPFVADDIVGRWEVIGEFTDKEEFLQHPQFGKPTSDIGDTQREIYCARPFAVSMIDLAVCCASRIAEPMEAAASSYFLLLSLAICTCPASSRFFSCIA